MASPSPLKKSKYGFPPTQPSPKAPATQPPPPQSHAPHPPPGRGANLSDIPGELLHEHLGRDAIMAVLQTDKRLRNTVLQTSKELAIRFNVPLAQPDQARLLVQLACMQPRGLVTLKLHGQPPEFGDPAVWPCHKLLCLGPAISHDAIRIIELKKLKLNGVVDAFLSKCTNLESLTLEACSIYNLTAKLKQPMLKLTYLSITGTKTAQVAARFSPQAWAQHLAKLPNLNSLTVDQVADNKYLRYLSSPLVTSLTRLFEDATLPMHNIRQLAGWFTGLQALHITAVVIKDSHMPVLATLPHLTSFSCNSFELQHSHKHPRRWTELSVDSISVMTFKCLPLTAAAVIHTNNVVILSSPQHRVSTEQLAKAVSLCSHVTLDCTPDQVGFAVGEADAMDAQQAAAVPSIALFSPAKVTILRARGLRPRLVQAMQHRLPSTVACLEYHYCWLPIDAEDLVRIVACLPKGASSVRIVGHVSEEQAEKICQQPATRQVTVMFASARSSDWSIGWLQKLRGKAGRLVSIESR